MRENDWYEFSTRRTIFLGTDELIHQPVTTNAITFTILINIIYMVPIYHRERVNVNIW